MSEKKPLVIEEFCKNCNGLIDKSIPTISINGEKFCHKCGPRQFAAAMGK